MNSTGEDFSDTPFYHEREAAILALLKQSSLIRPALPGLCGGALYDLTNAIHYAGCIAGSYGIPLESESVGLHLSLLYRSTTHDRWPEVSRLLSELYARARSEYIARLKASFDSPWAPSVRAVPASSARPLRRKPAPVTTPPPNHAARKSRKPLPVLKRP